MSKATSTPNMVKISEIAAEMWRPVAIFDFDIGQKWCYGPLRTVHVYDRAKFGDNISIGGRVIMIFFFLIGGGPPSWILL